MAAPTMAELYGAVWSAIPYPTKEAATQLRLFVNDLAAALIQVWTALHASILVNGVVARGTSPPGGPVAGAQVTVSAGGFQRTSLFSDAAGMFVSSFGILPPALQQLVVGITTGWEQSFASWFLGLTAQGTASGGIASWVPLAPGPAAPGPWTAGILDPLPLGEATSPGDAEMIPASIVTKMQALIPFTTVHLVSFLTAWATGLLQTWTTWKTSVVSGGGATGTANPPNGAITVGTLTGATLA